MNNISQIFESFWPDTWTNFADWWDLALAVVAVLLIALIVIWWRQQTRNWFRIVVAALLAALIFCISSIYVFQVPPHQAGCDGICTGWAGYPLSVALLDIDGTLSIAPLDFMLNLLLLWLLLLGGTLVWSALAVVFEWWKRPVRLRILFVVLVVLLPWALLPRVLSPPQPRTGGEELRLANNGRRAAEFTYRISGAWIQRLGFEDIRYTEVVTGDDTALSRPLTQICLRGYTYFYVPWRRYRITLDASGTTALNLVERPLTGSCWEE
jgi:hypothetical protein